MKSDGRGGVEWYPRNVRHLPEMAPMKWKGTICTPTWVNQDAANSGSKEVLPASEKKRVNGSIADQVLSFSS